MTEKRKLPEGWRWVKLGGKNGVTNIINGSTPSTDVPEYWNGNILWATPTDLGNLRSIYIEDTERKITQAGLDSCSATLLPAGTVLMTSRAPVGNLAISNKPICTNQGFKSFVPKESVSSLYLYFAISKIVPEIQKISHGNTFTEITKTLVSDFQIPLPSTLDDQIAIANKLESKIDEIEKLYQEAVCQKEAVTAMQDAILREAFPYKEGDKLPDAWKWSKLGDIAKLKNGINFDTSQVGSGKLVLDVFNMFSNNIYPVLDNLYRVNVDLNGEYILQKDDILFVRSSVKKEGVGWPTVFQGYREPITFCGFLIRARLIQSGIFAPYLVHYFRKSSVRNEFISASGQSTITNINQTNLSKVLIPIPTSFDDQLAIVKKVEQKMANVEKMRQAANIQYEALGALRGAVLREVFDFERS